MKPNRKMVNIKNCPLAICAIYEPHPFRSSVISEVTGTHINTGIKETEKVWVYYDWCGNPIGLGNLKPDGTEVETFTSGNLGFGPDDENGVRLAEYLNREVK